MISEEKKEKLQKTVHMFLEAGFNISPEMVRFLSESEDPVGVSTKLLCRLAENQKEILVLTPEVLDESKSATVEVPMPEPKARAIMQEKHLAS